MSFFFFSIAPPLSDWAWEAHPTMMRASPLHRRSLCWCLLQAFILYSISPGHATQAKSSWGLRACCAPLFLGVNCQPVQRDDPLHGRGYSWTPQDGSCFIQGQSVTHDTWKKHFKQRGISTFLYDCKETTLRRSEVWRRFLKWVSTLQHATVPHTWCWDLAFSRWWLKARMPAVAPSIWYCIGLVKQEKEI